MKPPAQRTGAEWRYHAEAKLGLWWLEWEAPLRRRDDLLATIKAGDNLALLARQMGLGRQKWIAEALVEADMWDRRVVVLCKPMMRLYWKQALTEAGLPADRVIARSIYSVRAQRPDKYVAMARDLAAADVLVIEPDMRPGTKLFAALVREVKAAPSPQIIVTNTLIWGAQLAPPRYVDSCLKLLGYLDAPEDIKVCWADDCWEAAV